MPVRGCAVHGPAESRAAHIATEYVDEPLAVEASAASVCADTLVIAQPVPDDLGDEPMARWRGGDDPNLDYMEWWLPNLAWYRQMLKKLGFRSIEVVGRFNAAMQAITGNIGVAGGGFDYFNQAAYVTRPYPFRLPAPPRVRQLGARPDGLRVGFGIRTHRGILP